MKIKIKMINKDLQKPIITKKGDWIDLRASEDVRLYTPYADISKYMNTDEGRKKVHKVHFHTYKIPLGIAVQLPDGFEAVINARSSLFYNKKAMLTNSQGVIDNSYKGNDDQWFAEVIAFEDTVIYTGDRICQFRIQLSQKATFWQKLKWFLSNNIEIEYVDSLNSNNRGGFGSTGIK